MSVAQKLVYYGDRLRALAVHGVHYADNVYDRGRCATIQGIAAELLALATGATLDFFDPLHNSIMLHSIG